MTVDDLRLPLDSTDACDVLFTLCVFLNGPLSCPGDFPERADTGVPVLLCELQGHCARRHPNGGDGGFGEADSLSHSDRGEPPPCRPVLNHRVPQRGHLHASPAICACIVHGVYTRGHIFFVSLSLSPFLSFLFSFFLSISASLFVLLSLCHSLILFLSIPLSFLLFFSLSLSPSFRAVHLSHLPLCSLFLPC